MDVPGDITPRRAESGQVARSLGPAKRRRRGDPARHFVCVTRTAQTLAAATALLQAGPTAPVALPVFDHPMDRDDWAGWEIGPTAEGAVQTPAQRAAWLAERRSCNSHRAERHLGLPRPWRLGATVACAGERLRDARTEPATGSRRLTVRTRITPTGRLGTRLLNWHLARLATIPADHGGGLGAHLPLVVADTDQAIIRPVLIRRAG